MQEIGATIDNGCIAFSPDDKLVAWRNAEDKISYRTLAAEGRTKQFDCEVNGRFTFSADSQFLIVPKLYRASEEELRARKAVREQELIMLREGCREIQRQQKEASSGQSSIAMGTLLFAFAGWAVLGAAGTAAGLPYYCYVKGPTYLNTVTRWGKNWWNQKLEEQKEQLEKRIRAGYLGTKIQFLPLQANAKASAIEIFTDAPISSISFSADTKYCITVEEFKLIKQNLETGESEKEFINLDLFTNNVTLSPNGKWWAIESKVVANANSVQLVLSETQEVKSRFAINRDKESEMAFSSDEKWLVIIERDGLLTLISTDSGKRTTQKASFGGFYAIWWSKTEKDTLIGMGKDYVLRKLRIVATEEAIKLYVVEKLLQMQIMYLNSEIENLKAAIYNLHVSADPSVTYQSGSFSLSIEDLYDFSDSDSDSSSLNTEDLYNFSDPEYDMEDLTEEEQVMLLQTKLRMLQAKFQYNFLLKKFSYIE